MVKQRPKRFSWKTWKGAKRTTHYLMVTRTKRWMIYAQLWKTFIKKTEETGKISASLNLFLFDPAWKFQSWEMLSVLHLFFPDETTKAVQPEPAKPGQCYFSLFVSFTSYFLKKKFCLQSESEDWDRSPKRQKVEEATTPKKTAATSVVGRPRALFVS